LLVVIWFDLCWFHFRDRFSFVCLSFLSSSFLFWWTNDSLTSWWPQSEPEAENASALAPGSRRGGRFFA
jgi:hypothetical protein